MPPSHSYGWKRDLPDQRDIRYGAVYRAPSTVPTSIDLRPQCPPIVNQGALGSCTANALAGAIGFLEVKDGLDDIAMSRLFIYYNERVIENTVSQDSGAQIRDGIKTLAAQGCCAESDWPYAIANFTKKPAAACYKEGLDHQITAYQRIDAFDQMRACLVEGFPFVFGFSVYESFESPAVAKSGIAPMPKKTERLLGGHAVVCVGYDDASKRLIVRNSWGTEWGMQGYFTLPYGYLSNPDLAADFWTIRRGEEM